MSLHVNQILNNTDLSQQGLRTTINAFQQPALDLSKTPNRLKLITQFSDVFTGIGKLKNDQVKLYVNSSVTPVAQKARRIPFHLRQKVDKELEKLRNADVIDDITEEITPWVSPNVIIPKQNSPDEIRLCVDMRQANKAIDPMPTLDDIIQEVNGASIFCKLDMNNAFLQLELEENSRSITTFVSHRGLHRFKRLSYGTSSASEVLQLKIEKVLRGIPRCKNIADDIIIYGNSTEEIDDTLKQILHRFYENNLTLNLRKCEFDKLQMEFFGFVFSQRGISPSENKVASIKKLQPPTSATEVRSFLGMTNYLSRFIPHYSARTAPLRTLTEKDVAWNWGHLEQQAFEDLKQALTSDKVLAYFDPKRKTAIVTDAGPKGISAILLQNVNNMDKKVIAYSSRALTDAETRYSQLEKEALAILHGCEKFRVYLIGSIFEVYTDHLPLVNLLNKPNKKIPSRKMGVTFTSI